MITQYAYLVTTGLFVSFTGSLPLGVLNITAMQIASRESFKNAMQFAVGVTMIEMGYLLLTLNIIGERANQLRFFSVCNIVSVILLLFMAAGSFMSLSSKQRKNIVVDNGMNRLLLGISLSAVNPMQIPFWMGWAILLASRLHASGVFSGNIIFTLSAGIGTFLALILFIILGKKLSELMDRKKKMISIILGCLFTALAAFQVLRLLQLP